MELFDPPGIEQIGNPGLQRIVRTVFNDKKSTIPYLTPNGNPFEIELSKVTGSMLMSYMREIIKICSSGSFESESRMGFAFEMMIGEVVKELFNNRPGCVIYSPAVLDFQLGGIDIVGGNYSIDSFIPDFFIDVKLTEDKKHRNGQNGHIFLGIPVSVLEGWKIFGYERKDLAAGFIRAADPQEYARDIAKTHGQQLRHLIHTRT